MRLFKIFAVWDDEARVWVATSDDVPGLCTEASTYEKLVKKLGVIIPELLRENGMLNRRRKHIPYVIESQGRAVCG